MKLSKRLVAGLSGTVLAASALMIVGASPASAVAPSGGCWVYTPTTPANIEDTVPSSSTSTSLAPWADVAGPAANYTLTSSGATTVGGTRNFDLTFNVGPKNGGPPASGTVYYYFSVNGTNLPVISKAFSAPGGAAIPGDTITGSFTIGSAGSTNITLRKVIYDIPSFFTRVNCNGQTSGTAATNPATTPVNTNINSTFTAVGPSATITAISNQTVTTHARRLDTISFAVSSFSGAGTGTASICNASGASCDPTTSSVSIDGAGTGTGTLAVDTAPATGSRTLKVVSGGDTSLTPITILSGPTVSTNVVGGGAGTIVTVTGTNWDPNQTVSVSSTKSGPPFPPPPTADAAVTTTADASGNISQVFTVNDPTTAFIGASRTHAAGPPPVVIFGSAAFAFSGDACTAKVGTTAPAANNCKLLETVDLTITAGDLKMSKQSGNVAMSGVTLNGAAQTSTGALKDVTVMDYRGGTLGWSLVARFSGLTGPAKPTTGNFTLPSTALSWTPSCTAGTNNDDTITTGAGGAVFTTATTDVPVCAVTGAANLGADLTSGGDTLVQSPLSLAVPANQASGAYTGTIQFTLS